jgi:hypothetical protein
MDYFIIVGGVKEHGKNRSEPKRHRAEGKEVVLPREAHAKKQCSLGGEAAHAAKIGFNQLMDHRSVK